MITPTVDVPHLSPFGTELDGPTESAKPTIPLNLPVVESMRLSPAPKTNIQLYVNRLLTDEGTALDARVYADDTEALNNSLPPNLVVLHEQPLHRAVIMLKAAGLSNNEIAARTGYTYPWVSQVLRQPWARTRLIEELNNAGRAGIQNLLSGTVVDSILKLVEIRDTATKSSDIVAASRELLNRALGMPTQHIEQVTSDATTPKELAAIERELSALASEEKRLTGN